MALYAAIAWLLAAIVAPGLFFTAYFEKNIPKSIEVGQKKENKGRPRRVISHEKCKKKKCVVFFFFIIILCNFLIFYFYILSSFYSFI